MRHGRRIALSALAAALVAVPVTHAAAPGGMTGFSIAGDQATATLHAGTYTITEGPDGERIDMDGFGHLMIPGSPLLPMKRFLVALPPGARAREVRVVSAGAAEVPGTHRVEPFAGMLPLVESPGLEAELQEMRREWQANFEAVYTAADAFPERIAWLAGTGTLRKYSYAAIAFCPFAYEPRSGRLVHHGAVEVTIEYDLPVPGTAEAQQVEQLLHDRAADERAAALFPNYAAIHALYEPPGTAPRRAASYDYVIITTAGLVGSVTSSNLPGYRTSLGHSVRTVLTTDSEIAGQPGGDLAEQIRNFLRSYYPTWGIEYVLIVGDYATVPMRICYPDPTFHVYNPSNPGLVCPGTPTDHYYADLSFPDAVSWDSDADGFHGEYLEDTPDFLAEVAVGRIPVNDPARIQYTLDKLVAFDADTGSWKSNALLAGSILFFENQDHGGGGFVDGSSCLDSIGTALMGAWNVTEYSEQVGLVTSSFPGTALNEAAFNTAWRTGEYAVVNWSGHGWCDAAARTVWTWDDGDGVPEFANGEIQSQRFIGTGSSSLEDDRPSIVFAISCNVGYPDPNPYGNLGVDLLTQPGWGSSAGIVSSSRPAAVSSDWRANPGGTESICYEFNRYMLAHGERVGDALYAGKFYATVNYGWDHVYEPMNMYNFNLYGDPALAVNRSVATDVVADRGAAGTGALHLGPARPNPFALSTGVRFSLPVASPVRVTVYDIRGREVAVLAESEYEAGQHTVVWDGTDASGKTPASGLYFVAVDVRDQRAVRKVVRLR